MAAIGADRRQLLALGLARNVAVGLVAALGASPSAMIGVRNALERRSGGATVPVGAALIGTPLAVAALCATGVCRGESPRGIASTDRRSVSQARPSS